MAAGSDQSRSPAARMSDRPVSGLARGRTIPTERTAFPDPKVQWLEVRHSAYRCGGSTGLAINASPVSRFTPRQFNCDGAPIGRFISYKMNAADCITNLAIF